MWSVWLHMFDAILAVLHVHILLHGFHPQASEQEGMHVATDLILLSEHFTSDSLYLLAIATCGKN